MDLLTYMEVVWGDPNKATYISDKFVDQENGQLIVLLHKNANVFAWKLFDMPGISSDVISHRLRVWPKVKLVRKKNEKISP